MELSNSDWLLIIIASEAVGISIIVFLVLALMTGRRQQKDTKATTKLVEKIKASKVVRQSELEKTLKEIYNYKGDDLTEETKKLIKLENEFYQRFIKTYLSRDEKMVETVDEDLRKLLKNYSALVPQNAHAEEDQAKQEAIEALDNLSAGGDFSDQIARLKKTVTNLSEDMKVYKTTLNRLFFEYTAMFGVDVDPRNQLSAQEILGRLESGRLGDPDEGSTKKDSARDAEIAAVLKEGEASPADDPDIEVAEDKPNKASISESPTNANDAADDSEELDEDAKRERAEIEAFESEFAELFGGDKKVEK